MADAFPALPQGTSGAASVPSPRFAARRGVRPLYVATLWLQAHKPVLVITPRAEDSRILADQLLTYLGESAPIYLLPEPEVLPFERLAVDGRTVNQRLIALAALANWESETLSSSETEPARKPLVIASVAAALRYTLSPANFDTSGSAMAAACRVHLGQRVRSTENLLGGWLNLGYRHEPVVESPGTFSLRGGDY